MLQGGVATLTADIAQGGKALSNGLWTEFRRLGKGFRGLMANHSYLLGFRFPFSELIQLSFYLLGCTGGCLVSAPLSASDL